LASLTEIMSPFSGQRLNEWFSDLIELWHDTAPIEPTEYQSPKGMTQWLHYQNFVVWHLEEMLRHNDIKPDKIHRLEQAVDKHTNQRMDVLEQIDIWIDNVLETAGIAPADGTPVHSETPANIINRLSVLSLKIFHLKERLDNDNLGKEDKHTVNLRFRILEEQVRDVSKALDQLLLDLRQARKKHKVYRQFKIYNDPSFHPELYSEK